MKTSKELKIVRLSARIGKKQILQGISFTVRPGSVHVVMGPNGSGKSTLAHAMMGHPDIHARGKVLIDGKNILTKTPDERSRLGLFLAFQSPVAVPGVSVVSILREVYSANSRKKPHGSSVKNPVFQNNDFHSVSELVKEVKDIQKYLGIKDDFLSRGVHDGFSGGEKKKMEMLMALVMKPKYAIFDEVDTGLDVDSLRIVAKGISRLSKFGTGILIVTHYRRITDYLPSDAVHILIDGRIVKEGARRLISTVEKKGYAQFAR